jgi:hypothetical protein
MQLSSFGPIWTIWPNFVTSVGSSNLIYALIVVITFSIILCPKVKGIYFQNWLFWPNLAPIWPNLVHLKGPALCQWCSGGAHDTQKHDETPKSRVSEVKNSRYIFYSFFAPFKVQNLSNSLINMSFNLRQGLKLSIQSHHHNQFWW